MLQIHCPQCSVTNTVPESEFGHYVACAHCQAKFYVPVPPLEKEAHSAASPDKRLVEAPGTAGPPRIPTPRPPKVISHPTVIQAAGNKPKIIQEFVGRVNTQTAALSIARMQSPSGWLEPGQTPEFDEYTVVLKGMLRVTWKQGSVDVAAGQGVITHAGEWVQYSTPGADGAEYIAVCAPAFAPNTVHRDA
jgi:mannose-6-phosphate isomerase-like protein (cupin superfamily)